MNERQQMAARIFREWNLNSFPKMVHIAGTNGKGSVGALLAQALLLGKFGKICHFSSPHVLEEQERIRINGDPISKEIWRRWEQKVAGTIRETSEKATYFGTTFLMAMGIAVEQECEWLIVETGIGGKEDITNVIQPELSLITTIDYDHRNLLGNTLREIAEQKAGIIKWNTPVITVPQQDEVRKVLQRTAERMGSKYREAEVPSNVMCRLTDDKSRMEVTSAGETWESNLIGVHQLQNIALAKAACEALHLESRYFRQALLRVQWKGRFQKVQQCPEIWVDGAHNDQGVTALIANIRHFLSTPVYLIFGMHKDKISEKKRKELFSIAKERIFVEIEGVCDEEIDRQVSEAIALFRQKSLEESTPIVICGSLYLFRSAYERGEKA